MNASTLLIILLSLVGLAIALIVVFTMRRRAISKLSGAFDCSLNVGDDTRRPRWRLGVAVFTVSSLDWYPVFSLVRKPTHRFPRADLEITARSAPGAEQQHSVLPDALIVTCDWGKFEGRKRTMQLALVPEDVATFSSWLESAPPGFNLSMGRFT